jgi:hypothetical protein
MAVEDRPSQALLNAQKELERRRRLAGVSYQPPRRSCNQPVQPSRPSLPVIPTKEEIHPSKNRAPSTPPAQTATSASSVQAVRIAPTLAAYCLEKDHRYRGHALDAPYRLYKILQALDRQGRGWLPNPFVEKALTSKESDHHIYGRRQLKNILMRGEGLFWQRAKRKGELRIRLVARAKVAGRLLNSRLRGREVTFPLKHMLGTGRGRQAAVNAALYTAVHAGQIGDKRKAAPISRATLRHVSGCSSYRQRRYEKRMGITVTRHIHILAAHSEYKLQQLRIHHGLPAYKHTDYRGKINRHRRGADYIARRLPNSYSTPDTFAVLHSRRQRTINRQLAGLCHMGSEGSDSDNYVRLFHENAVTAVRAFNRDSQTTVYCPLSRCTKTHLWRVLT